MIDHQVFSLLKLLSPEEMKALDRCIQSRFFYHEDDPKKVIELFNLVKKHAPNFDNQHVLNYPATAKKLSRPARNVPQLLSGLHNVVRNFINWTYLDDAQDKYYQDLGLLNFYRYKRESKKFETLFDRMEQNLRQSSSKQNKEIAFQLFMIHFRKYDWMQANQPSGDINLLNTLGHLESFFLTQKAQLIYALLLRDRNTPIKFNGYADFVKQLDAYLLTNPNNNDLLELYRLAILLLMNDEEVSFEHFERTLQAKKAKLSEEDFQTLAGMERQILLERILDGQWQEIPKLFALYKRHIDAKLIDRANLPPSMFSNIVRYGCACGELDLDWVGELLKEYRDKTSIAPKLYDLNYAYYLFYKGELDRAEKLIDPNFEEYARKIAAKCLRLMIAYAKRSSILDYNIDSFRHLLDDPKSLGPNRKKIYNNFKNNLQRMAKLNPELNTDPNLLHRAQQYRKRLDALLEEIEVKKMPTAEPIWLLKELKKLREKGS